MNGEGSHHKDFDAWNAIKQQTNAESPRLYTVREVWWCQLGVNIGTEQDGKGERFLRPAIIVRSFGPDACLVVPLSTSVREHPLRIPVGVVDGRDAQANLSQLRVVDTRRLVEKIGFLDKAVFVRMRKAAHSPPCGGEAKANCISSINRAEEQSTGALSYPHSSPAARPYSRPKR